MKTLYLPLVLVVGGNIVYHLSQRSVPKAANPLVTVLLAWAVASALCAIALVFSRERGSIMESLRLATGSAIALGVGIAAVELGVLLAYRVGWKISVLPAVSSVAVALLLLPIGLFFFREQLTARGYLGLCLCLGGLVLLRL
jgi:drug/metabolite transporter (DMT)-like permease